MIDVSKKNKQYSLFRVDIDKVVEIQKFINLTEAEIFRRNILKSSPNLILRIHVSTC